MSRSDTDPLWDPPVPPESRGAGRPAPDGSAARRGKRRSGSKGRRQPAEVAPIARVLVDVPLAHLDRTFDYRVPRELDTVAVPGCRVRVRFAGQLVDGYLLDRAETTDHTGGLAYLERVVSAERVLPPRLVTLCRAVARRYGGTLADVLRLAVPPRHATVEAEPAAPPAPAPGEPDGSGWRRYPRGPAFLSALRDGRPAHAVWQALPGEDWPDRLAELAATAAAHGRGAVLVVPDHRDVDRVHRACVALAGGDTVVALAAGLGPAERYRRWLAVLRGSARIVVGTRAAMFAPVTDPGLYVVWDDGDDLHADPHAPYPQVRDVLVQRAHLDRVPLVVAGHTRTAEAQLLLESGWAHPVVAGREEVRARAPRVTPTGEDFDVARDEAARAARLPAVAFEAARAGLAAGAPVLVQVPRRGYVPGLACGRCRAPARCRRCAGPLMLPDGGGASGMPHCRWCGVADAAHRCAHCGSDRLRAVVVGARRTAEELGRAFPGTAVRTSGGGDVLAGVPARPALVVATPGAEPVAEGGYGAALLLDGWALLGRQDLRAAEETVRRWLTAATLVRPGHAGGRVVVGAEAGIPAVQALVRWDPGRHAELELDERRELGFPPAVRMAGVEGAPEAVAELLDEIDLPDTAEVLGPVPLGETDVDGNADRERVLLRVPRTDGRALADAVRAVRAVRDARKAAAPVRIRLDPLDLV